MEEVSANAQSLCNLLTHASAPNTEWGWGKLLGYFDIEQKTLVVEKSYPLALPKSDERMRKEDVLDEILNKKICMLTPNLW